MQKSISPLFAGLALALSALLPVQLFAASLSWDANGRAASQTDGSGAWLDNSQWWNGTTNVNWNIATPDIATIGNSGTGGTITLGTVTTGSLAFNSFSGSYLLGGGSLTINSGGITKNAGSGAVVITSGVTLGGAQTWTNNSSSLLSVKSQITTGGNVLTIDGTGSTTFAGSNQITDTGGLVKNGSGILNLAGVNVGAAQSGSVTLNAGTLNLSGIGSSGGFNNISSLGSGTFILNGGTFDNTSGVDATLGYNNVQTWGGNFTFAGMNSLNMGTGAVTLTGNRTVTVNANNLSVGGVIGDGAGGFGITKEGAGMLTVSGNNTFTGVVNVNAGILRATSSLNATGTGAATVTLAGGELQLANSNANIAFNRNTTVTANSQITADTTVGFGNGDSRVNTFTMGTLSIGAQTLTVASGSGVLSIQNAASGTSGITFGSTNLTGNATFNILNPTLAPAFRIATGATRDLVTLLTLGAVTDNGNTATFTGDGNFAQTGVWGGGAGGITLGSGFTGIATLNQTNTFTGAVTINSGRLVANTLANGGVASNLGASSNAASNLVLGGGTLQTSSALSIDRNFTLTNGTTSTINNSAGLTMTGSAASSTGSLIKLGAGTLTLAGTNLYTGTTSANAGNLTLGFSNALAPTDNILSSSSALALGGGTLTLTGKASTANNQTFVGTTINRGASTISATSGASGTMNTALAGITRTAGQFGTINIVRPSAGNITTSTSNTNGILGPWVTISGTDYATNSGGNIVALNTGTSAETTWLSGTDNYRMGASTTLTGARTINTLRNTGGTATLGLGASGAFDLATNGILNADGNLFTINRSGSSTAVVNVAAGSELVVGGIVNIDAPLTMGSGSILTKSNAATLQIRGGLITSGDVTLVNNAGSFNVTIGGTPSPTSVATLGGNLTLAGAVAIGFNAAGFDINNGNRTIFANGTATQTISGTINNTGGSAGQKLTIGGSGLVTIGVLTTGTNAPGLEINGTGVYTFGTASTFTGGVTLTAGTALLNNATGLGTSASILTAKGGTITLNGSTTTYTNGLVFDGSNSTPINFTTSLEGFNRQMTFSGSSTVQSAPTLNFTNAYGNGGGTRTFSGLMTLNSNLTLTGTHTGNVEFTNGLTFAGNRTITLNDTGNTTIRGALTGGSNTLTIAGTNQRVFFGTSAGAVTGTTGGVIVSGGLVKFGDDDQSGVNGNTFTGGVTLTGGTIMGQSSTGVPGSVTKGPFGTGTLTLRGGSIGTLSGSGGTTTIANDLVLDGVNNTPISFINGTDGFFRQATYSGTTTIQNAPTLNFTKAPGNNNTGAVNFTGAKSLNSNLTFTGTHSASVTFTSGFNLGGNDRTITFNDDGTTSIAGDLAGAASTLTLAGTSAKAVIAGFTGSTAHGLTVNGSANSLFTMTVASTYTGTTSVTGGTLVYGLSNAISTGAVTVNGSTAVLALGGFTDTVGTVTLDGGGKITGSASTLTSTGSFEMKSGAVTAILAGSGIALNKTTSGTVALSGANTYTGDTTVTVGTLLVNNTSGSGAGTGNLTVAAGATLGGSGTLGNSTAIIDGIVAPGNSIGTLSSGALAWNFNSGSEWKFELGVGAASMAAAGTLTDSDLLNITGNFVKGTSTGATWVFDFQNSLVSVGWFKLVDYTGSTGFSASDFSAVNGSGTFVVDSTTSALYLNAVPEPSTWALLAFSLTAVMVFRRRRA